MNQRVPHARVAELVDATDSKSVVREDVGVRVPPRVHLQKRPLSAPNGDLRGVLLFAYPTLARFQNALNCTEMNLNGQYAVSH